MLPVVVKALSSNRFISRHVGETLKVIKYHGKTRIKDSTNLRDSDIILTTYHTLTEEFKRNSSPLHDITWFRIVLDEGKESGCINKSVPILEDPPFLPCIYAFNFLSGHQWMSPVIHR